MRVDSNFHGVLFFMGVIRKHNVISSIFLIFFFFVSSRTILLGLKIKNGRKVTHFGRCLKEGDSVVSSEIRSKKSGSEWDSERVLGCEEHLERSENENTPGVRT